MSVRTLASISAAFTAKFNPNPLPGVLGELAASSAREDDEVLQIQAAAGVRSFQQPTDKIVVVKVAGDHGFSVSGQYVYPGELVELKQGDANLQVSLGRTAFATDEEINAPAAKGKK